MTTAGATSWTGRHLADVDAVARRDPVVRRVEVRAGVLAGGDVVPVPGRSAVVVAADLPQREAVGVPERLRQLQDRSRGRQRRGEVDDLDGSGPDGVHEVGEQGQRVLLAAAAGSAVLQQDAYAGSVRMTRSSSRSRTTACVLAAGPLDRAGDPRRRAVGLGGRLGGVDHALPGVGQLRRHAHERDRRRERLEHLARRREVARALDRALDEGVELLDLLGELLAGGRRRADRRRGRRARRRRRGRRLGGGVAAVGAAGEQRHGEARRSRAAQRPRTAVRHPIARVSASTSTVVMLRLTPPASSQAPSTALENGCSPGSATPHHGHDDATGSTGALQRWQDVADLMRRPSATARRAGAVATTAAGPRSAPGRSATTSAGRLGRRRPQYDAVPAPDAADGGPGPAARVVA